MGRAEVVYLTQVKGARGTTSGKKAAHEARIALQTAAMDLFMRDIAGEDVTALRKRQAWLAKRLIY